MILLVIKITLSASLVNTENNKQIKLAKKIKASFMPGYTMCVSKFNQKNPTSPDQAHGHDTSSKVNGPLMNHLQSLGTQKYSLRVDGPR
jgi:hypothetical protein